MKKLAATLCLSALATAAFAQGTVNFSNGTFAFARTNAVGLPSAGGTAGNTAGGAASANSFFFGVFTANSTITSLSPSLQELLTPNWTFTGLYGTNTTLTTGGRLSGGAGVAATTGWQPGVTNSFVILGWSANLGHDWNAIAADLGGATLQSGYWSGGGFSNAPAGSFLGASIVGFGAAGGGTAGAPAFSLFGQAATSAGNPVTTAFDMFVVNVPEPTSVALIGLGTAALVIFRRRK